MGKMTREKETTFWDGRGEENMRVVFFGYGAMGYEGLSSLLKGGKPVVAVFTHRDQEDERQWFPSVAELAKEWGIPVYFGEELSKKELTQVVRQFAPGVILSVYYRRLIPSSVLKLAKYGAYNLHGSLLPRYRGCSPANWQILHGEFRSGLTLHLMEAKADTGPIVAQMAVPVDYRDTAFSLYGKQLRSVERLLHQFWQALEQNRLEFIPQEHRLASYFGRRFPEDGRIDWRKSAPEIDRLVRAVTHPYPGAFTTLYGQKLYIWESYPYGGPDRPAGELIAPTARGFLVATGGGWLEVLSCQWEGGEEMDGATFWNTFGLKAGDCCQ